ncbi:hypothetical protein ILFOPFJJ_01068 [Ensifer psoraleae]|nr:hypothetical protein [Sinorhizobium psoraleae]
MMFKVGNQVVHKDNPNKGLIVEADEKDGTVLCRIPGTGKIVMHKAADLRKVDSGPMRVGF